MCLSVPGEIVEINGSTAKVNISGNKVDANIQLITEPQIGDYVLVHAGFAIEKISEEEAKETLELFKEYDEFQDNQE